MADSFSKPPRPNPGGKPHALNYWAKRSVLIARRIPRGITRENVIANLKTLLWVVPLTVLIWIYAERQQLVKKDNISLHLSLKSADPGHRVVTLLSPKESVVTVTLEGSQSGIEKAKEAADRTMAQPLEIEISSSLPTGSQTLLTLEQIANNRVFTAEGVKVDSCMPETLLVQIDSVSEVDVPVQAPTDLPGLEKATFIPATVKMRGPTQLLDDLKRHGRLVAIADLANTPLLKEPGEHDNLVAKLLPPIADDNLSIEPGTATANLRMREADESLEVSQVPVFLLAPKYVIDNYRIDYKTVLDQPVTVVGPPGQIALFKGPKKPNLIALLELGPDDANFKGPKPIRFQGLPDGVKVKPEIPERTVQVDVTPR